MFSSSWAQHKGNLWLSTAVWPVKFLSVLLLPVFFDAWALPGPAQAGGHWHGHNQAPPTYQKYLLALPEPVRSGLGCWWFHSLLFLTDALLYACTHMEFTGAEFLLLAGHASLASPPFPGCLAFLNSYFSCFQMQSSVITLLNRLLNDFFFSSPAQNFLTAAFILFEYKHGRDKEISAMEWLDREMPVALPD